MQHDQAITLLLQEIDENFAKSHQTITGRILPSVKKYGVASARTWQGARVSIKESNAYLILEVMAREGGLKRDGRIHQALRLRRRRCSS